jgi:hypothetical protein
MFEQVAGLGGAAARARRSFSASGEPRRPWHDPRKASSRRRAMGRALEVTRTRTLEELFGYFGLDDVQPELVAAHRRAISERFAAEVHEIRRLCTRLREKERFTIVRAALRLAYDAAIPHGASAR